MGKVVDFLPGTRALEFTPRDESAQVIILPVVRVERHPEELKDFGEVSQETGKAIAPLSLIQGFDEMLHRDLKGHRNLFDASVGEKVPTKEREEGRPPSYFVA